MASRFGGIAQSFGGAVLHTKTLALRWLWWWWRFW